MTWAEFKDKSWAIVIPMSQARSHSPGLSQVAVPGGCPMAVVPWWLSQRGCPRAVVPGRLSQGGCPSAVVPARLSQRGCPMPVSQAGVVPGRCHCISLGRHPESQSPACLWLLALVKHGDSLAGRYIGALEQVLSHARADDECFDHPQAIAAPLSRSGPINNSCQAAVPASGPSQPSQ